MDNVSFIKKLYEAFSRGDVPAVLEVMSPEVRWHQAESNPYMPSGEPWVGPEAVVNNLFVKLGAEWDAFTIHPKTFHEAGKSVIVEARYTGTYKATGKRLDAQVCHIWDIENGRITRYQQHLDTAKMRDAMGAAQAT